MIELRGRPAGIVFILGGIVYFLLLAVALIVFQLPPEVVLVLTLAGIGIPLVCLRPVAGLHLFLLAFYLETTLGQDSPVMKAVGVAILSGWLLNVAIRRKIELSIRPLFTVIALFVFWCGLTAIFADDSQAAILRTFQFAQMGIAAMMFSSVLDTTPKIRALFGAIVLWTSLSTLIAVAMYYLGLTPVAKGLMQNRNLLAMHINLAIIAAYVLFQTSRSPATKAILLASFPVFFLGEALTLSRTGIVILVFSLAFLWFRLVKERGFFVIGSTLAALCLVLLVLPDTFWHRAGTIVPAIERQEDTFGLRIKIWRVGVEMVQDHPITGVGAGNFLASFGRYAHGKFLWRHLSPHNAFVGVAAEMGVVGLGLFVLIFWLALAAARRAIRFGTLADSPEIRFLGIVAEVSLVAMVVACFTGDGEFFKLLWIMFGLALSLGRIGQEALERRRKMAPAPADQTVPLPAPGWGLTG